MFHRLLSQAARRLSVFPVFSRPVSFAAALPRTGASVRPMRPRSLSAVAAAPTREGVCSAQRQRGDAQEFLSGVRHTTWRVDYALPDKTVRETVFKPASDDVVARNLATGDIARAMGFDVTPAMQAATASLPVGLLGAPRQVRGLAMEVLPGEHACDAVAIQGRAWFGEFSREITKVQLVDAITGEWDRHGGNLLLWKDGKGRCRVGAIDNDECLGRVAPQGASKAVGLPKVMDEDMARGAEALSWQVLKAILLRRLGDPSPAQLAEARERLDALKKHVAQLRAAGRVVPVADWQEHVKHLDAATSYYAREVALHEGRLKQLSQAGLRRGPDCGRAR